MARTADITDKLSFEENPRLIVKGRELEVNADAPTMLKVMAMMDQETPGINDIKTAYEMLFMENAKKEVEKMGLKMSDWMVLVQEAVQLVVGDTSSQGER